MADAKQKLVELINKGIKDLNELEDHEDFIERMAVLEEKVGDLQDLLDGIYKDDASDFYSSSSEEEVVIVKKRKPETISKATIKRKHN